MQLGDLLQMTSHVWEIPLHRGLRILREVKKAARLGRLVLHKRGVGGNLTCCSHLLLKYFVRYNFELSHLVVVFFLNSKGI